MSAACIRLVTAIAPIDSVVPTLNVTIAMEHEARTTHDPTLYIVRRGDGYVARLTIEAKIDTTPHIQLSHIDGGDACIAYGAPADRGLRAVTLRYADAGIALEPTDVPVTASEVPVTDVMPEITKDSAQWSRDDALRIISVSCRLNIAALDQTFTDRKIQISTTPSFIVGGKHDRVIENLPFDVDFDSLASEDSFRVSGGATNGVERPDFERRVTYPNTGYVSAYWKDATRSELREVILVSVGAILGLAAACVLEWIRPSISKS